MSYTVKYAPTGIYRTVQMEENPVNESTLMNLRERAGLTRRQLANAIGVTEKTIYVWENSPREPKMTPSQIDAYIKSVGCSFEEFTNAIKRSLVINQEANDDN